MDDQIPIEEPEESGESDIKKELSDGRQTVEEEDDQVLEDDCITSSDGIFELIPFMAKLLSNLKCTFYSRNSEIVIASIELMSVQELVDRLLTNRIRPIRMHCGNDASFTISIFEDQFTKSISINSHNNFISNGNVSGNYGAISDISDNIVRFLPNMAVVTECSNLTLQIENGEFLIRSISYDSLAGLMARLKQYDIRPKQVDSLKDCVFSVVFNESSFANCASVERLFPPPEDHPPIRGGPGSTSTPYGLLTNMRRPRICPNYLRDYVVENKFEPSPSGLDLLPASSVPPGASFIGRSSSSLFGSPLGAFTALRGLCESSTSESSRGGYADAPSAMKRGRGRPRIRPKPTFESNGGIPGDPNAPKKPRGRPRRSDVVPNILGARPNSFISIQPKAMSRQELEQCIAKFLERDMAGSISGSDGLSK